MAPSTSPIPEVTRRRVPSSRWEPTAPLPRSRSAARTCSARTASPSCQTATSYRSTELYTRSPDGAIVSEQTLPIGQFDGIVALEDGSLLVASQDGHVVYRVPAGGGEPEVVAENIETPAAIGLDTQRNRLLVPQINAANITFVDLN